MAGSFLLGIKLIFILALLYVVTKLAMALVKKDDLDLLEEKVKKQKALIEKLKTLEIPDQKEIIKAEKKLEKLLKG